MSHYHARYKSEEISPADASLDSWSVDAEIEREVDVEKNWFSTVKHFLFLELQIWDHHWHGRTTFLACWSFWKLWWNKNSFSTDGKQIRSLAFQDNLRLHPLPRRERLVQKMGSDHQISKDGIRFQKMIELMIRPINQSGDYKNAQFLFLFLFYSL